MPAQSVSRNPSAVEPLAAPNDAHAKAIAHLDAAGNAFFSAHVIFDDAPDTDLADYALRLVFTGLERLASFCRRYAEASPDSEDLQGAILDCAEMARECEQLGPAAPFLADKLEALARGRAAIGQVEVHSRTAEQYLRAKMAKSAKTAKR